MLAHTLKDILRLAPEAFPLVKQANVEQELPLDNKASCIATALQVAYFEKIAYHPVDAHDLEKIARAVHLYGVKDQVDSLVEQMVKAASDEKSRKEIESPESYMLKEALFRDNPTSEYAQYLYKEAESKGITPSDEVKLYSGHAYLNKEAALKSLSVRFHKTQDQSFVKLARAVKNVGNLEPEDNVKLASFVNSLDVKHGLSYKGHDFFKEAFFKDENMVKAAMTVKLAGKACPYESIERVGRDKIAHYIGDDIASEFDGGPANFKQVAETLPLDLQNVLLNLTKNV